MARYLIFSVVSLTLLLHSLSDGAVAVAFPEIASYFGTSITTAGWLLSIFQLAMIISIPLAGKASDVVGRKRTLLFTMLLFTIGSFLCAIAPTIYWLILFRAIQGAGAGGFITSASGIVSDTFPASRQRSIGLVVSILGFGMALGPSAGGWLIQSFGWRSIFLFNTPLGVSALAAAGLLLKPDRNRAKVSFDFNGIGLLGPYPWEQLRWIY